MKCIATLSQRSLLLTVCLMGSSAYADFKALDWVALLPAADYQALLSAPPIQHAGGDGAGAGGDAEGDAAGGAVGGLRKSVPRKIDGVHTVPACQRGVTRRPRVCGSAGAMEQEDGRPVPLLLHVPADGTDRVKRRVASIGPRVRQAIERGGVRIRCHGWELRRRVRENCGLV